MKNLLTITSLTLIAIFLSFFVGSQQNRVIFQDSTTASVIDAAIVQKDRQKQQLQEIHKNLEAKAACILDIETGEMLFDFNGKTLLPLASLTKLMTAVVAVENFSKNTLIEIPLEAIFQEGDSGFNVSDKWHFEDLLKIMLLSSSNDSAYSIAVSLRNDLGQNDSFFVNLMNKKAEEIGLTNIYFLNPTGLDISNTQAGAYGNCENVVKLMAYILDNYPGLLDITAKENASFKELNFENTNKLVGKLPFFLAGKTGFSDLAGGNLVVVVNRGLGKPVVIAVLGSSFEGRFKDIEMLYNEVIWF